MAITLFDFQRQAIDRWLASAFRGILEMATGTGKTYTAVGAIDKFLQRAYLSLVVIVVPFKHLVKQWQDAIEKFPLEDVSVIPTMADGTSWRDTLWAIKKLAIGKIRKLIVITTYSGFASNLKSLSSVLLPHVDTLLVADEVHRLGVPSLISLERYFNFDAYLGLSATPERKWDSRGTNFIYRVVGDVVYRFSLKDALTTINPRTGDFYLTPFYYRVIPAFMNDEEWDRFLSLTRNIAITLSKKDSSDLTTDDKLALLMRSLLLMSVEDKIRVLSDLLPTIDTSKTLMFSSHPLFPKVRGLLYTLNIPYTTITHRDETATRFQKVEDFVRGNIDIILSMNVLDEGIDIPDAKTAVFVSMPMSPRRTIQRLGRVIRWSPVKDLAYVYDIVALPPTYVSGTMAMRLINPQLERVKMLSDLSVGGYAYYMDFLQIVEDKYGGDVV